VKVDALLSTNFPFREKKKQTLAERSVLLVAVEKIGVSFFCEKFLEGGLLARQRYHAGNNRWYARQRCDSFFTLFLTDTVK